MESYYECYENQYVYLKKLIIQFLHEPNSFLSLLTMKVFVKFMNKAEKIELELKDDCTIGDIWTALKGEGVDAHRLICTGKIICTVSDPENPTSTDWNEVAMSKGVKNDCTIIGMERKEKKDTGTGLSAQETSSVPAQAPPAVMPGVTGSIPGMPSGSEDVMALFTQALGFDMVKTSMYIQDPDNEEYAAYVLNNPTINNMLRENVIKDQSFARLKELNNDFFEVLLKDKVFMKQFAVTYISQFIQTKLGGIVQQSGHPLDSLGMLGMGGIEGGSGGDQLITLTAEENAFVEELMEKHSLPKEEIAIAFKGLEFNKEKTDECLTKAKNLSGVLGVSVIDCIDALLATGLNEEMAGGVLFG